MREKVCRRWLMGGVLLLTGAGAVVYGAGARGPGGTSMPGAASQPGTSPTVVTSTRVAQPLQADALLKNFPGNANVIGARSDARNFSVEGRVREVRIVNVDPPAGGAATAPAGADLFGSPGSKTEARVYLIGRSQSDENPVHFTCRFDKATDDAARTLKADQIVRLTGSIGTVTGAADRIELKECHDLSVTGEASVGERLVGNWRSVQLMVDGAALKKSNAARGIKSDDVPETAYLSPWHLDVMFKPDNTMALELVDNKEQTLKKLNGRYTILKDGNDEARVRFDIAGSPAQEQGVSFEAGNLKVTLPGLTDKFVLPDTRLGKVLGVPVKIDNPGLKNQAIQWFNNNLAPNKNPNTNIPGAISNGIDNAFSNHGMFVFHCGAASMRRGHMTSLLGAYGKLYVLEYTDAQTQANVIDRDKLNVADMGQWGTMVTPEVKLDNFTLNGNVIDPGKPLGGKITYRSTRKTVEAQYALVALSSTGTVQISLDKPGPDAQTVDFSLPAFQPGGHPANPRLIVFLVARSAAPGDLSGDAAARVIADPIVRLIDLAK